MTVRLVNRIPQIIATGSARASAAVEKTAYDIEAEAAARSRVDTGQMQGGWTTEVLGPMEREVGNSVEHTIPNEYGTVSMAAQPMLHPAIENAREPFIAAVSDGYK